MTVDQLSPHTAYRASSVLSLNVGPPRAYEIVMGDTYENV